MAERGPMLYLGCAGEGRRSVGSRIARHYSRGPHTIGSVHKGDAVRRPVSNRSAVLAAQHFGKVHVAGLCPLCRFSTG